MTPRYFDIHSHVTFKDYDQDLTEVLARMEDEGVFTIGVGVDKASSEASVAFAEGKENFFASIGLHPTDTTTETFSESEYKALAANPKVVAVGECGIDYFRLEGDAAEEKKRQRREFEKQVAFAVKYDKALMIHGRPSRGTTDAYADILSVLEHEKKDAGDKLRGDVHFFVGTKDIAKRFYEIGFTTSFTGVLTFTHDYDEVVRYAPLDMLMTETDCPFVAPVPFRGRRNEPSYVKYVVEAIAGIRGEDIEAVREASVQNALRVFSIQG
ncbi:MAG: TatD family hydrolase [Patescibacteria group bacterium]|nr:TatD family hydrolase [Patescibacteria group bacterium]